MKLFYIDKVNNLGGVIQIDFSKYSDGFGYFYSTAKQEIYYRMSYYTYLEICECIFSNKKCVLKIENGILINYTCNDKEYNVRY